MTDLESERDENNAATTTTGAPAAMRWTTRVVLTTISALLLVLFLYSAVTQHNDNDGVFVWMIFYYFSAFLALLAITFYHGMYKSSPELVTTGLHVIAALISVWGLILAVMSGIAFVKASAEDAGGDWDGANFNDKEEKAFEMGGAILGLAAAVFHGLALKYGHRC